ncbi:MAG: hypothetical protein WCR33_06115, partial [Bacilli bacterium]
MMISKIKTAINSKWAMPTLFSLAVFFWAIDFVDATVCIFAIYVCLVFFLCEDVKVAFAPILYIHFFVEYIFYSVANWIVYGTCIALAISSIIYYVIKKLVEYKKSHKPLKKGKLFWPLVVADIAYLLGGLIGNFNLLATVMVFAFSLISYLIYWIAINFCYDLKKYLLYLFICGAIFVSIQILIIHLTSGDIIYSITSRNYYIGSQNINVAALFLGMGMIASFSLGYKNKSDYLYFLLSLFFSIMIFVTYSRMMIFLAVLTLIFYSLVLFKSTKNKRKFMTTFIILFSLICLF